MCSKPMEMEGQSSDSQGLVDVKGMEVMPRRATVITCTPQIGVLIPGLDGGYSRPRKTTWFVSIEPNEAVGIHSMLNVAAALPM